MNEVKINLKGTVAVFLPFILVLMLSFSVYAQTYTTPSYTTPVTQPNNFQSGQYTEPNYQSHYSAQGYQYNDYESQINTQTCGAGQDFTVNIRPGGCMPMVVRSDLLEEQDVPVFCKLDAIKLNPLVDIAQIKNVEFLGARSPQIAGISYHPSLAALRKNAQLDSPLINDAGYVVVVLKREQVEKNMPDWVEANLTARLHYDIDKAFGTGKPQFITPVLTDAEWNSRYQEFSFWKAKGYARLNSIDGESASISVYSSSDRIMSTINLKVGQTSSLIYMPGFYCKAGVSVRLNNLEFPALKARLIVDNEEVWVRQGESFMDNKCKVTQIKNIADGGEVRIRCLSKEVVLKVAGGESVWLKQGEGEAVQYNLGTKVGEYYIGYAGVAPAGLKLSNNNFIVGIQNIREKYLLNGEISSNYLASLNGAIKSINVNVANTKEKYELEIKSKIKGIMSEASDLEIFVVFNDGNLGEHKFVAGGNAEKIYLEGGLESAFSTTKQEAEDIVFSYKDYKNQEGEYGKLALEKTAELARDLGKMKSQKELLNKVIEAYPGSKEAAGVELSRAGSFDYDYSKAFIDTGLESHYVMLNEIREPGYDDASVVFSVSGSEKRLIKGDDVLTGVGSSVPIYSIINSGNVLVSGSEYRVLHEGVNYKIDSGNRLSNSSDGVSYTLRDADINFARFSSEVREALIKYKTEYNIVNSNKKIAIGTTSFNVISTGIAKPGEVLLERNADGSIVAYFEKSKGYYRLVDNDLEFSSTVPVSWSNVNGRIITGIELEKIKNELVQYKQFNTASTSAQREATILKEFDENSATLQSTFKNANGGWQTTSEKMILGETKVINGNSIRLMRIDLKREASISILPQIPNGYSVANFSVRIGIEKRAIQLSPEKTLEMINKLNETIKKWQSIVDKLGGVIKGWKGACFATSTLLIMKGFFNNLGGKSMARQQVMRNAGGWHEICKKDMAENPGKYVSLDDCFKQNGAAINKDVELYEQEIKRTNNEISAINKDFTTAEGILGKSVNVQGATQKYSEQVFMPYVNSNKEQEITLGDGRKVKLEDVFKNQDSVNQMLKDGTLGQNDMKEIVTQGRILKQGGTASVAEKGLSLTLSPIEARKEKSESAASLSNTFKREIAVNSLEGEKTRAFVQVATIGSGDSTGGKLAAGDKVVFLNVPYLQPSISGGKTVQSFDKISGKTVAIKSNEQEPKGKGNYVPEKAFLVNEDGTIGTELAGEDYKQLTDYLGKKGISSFQETIPEICNNAYKKYEARFFETEPYKGMPAVIPVDIKKGWYAATKPVISGAFGIKPYTSAGEVKSFWLVNVGKNGLEEFDSSTGDDVPQIQINLDTGQPIGQISCLSSAEATALVNKAKSLIQEAARQYGAGKKSITLSGIGAVPVGRPGSSAEGTSCQDFMSPEDCHLLFNVCDPVICPSSRCNMGGAYQVDDVIQTGVVGSIALCLPNAREGIAVPVCLTGIQAGIDSYLSILKSFRDCLQESYNTGRHVGICDEIFSIYICEFFWRQIAPFMDMIIPKMIEMAYGQGTRGGGEYLTVMNAWDNMQKSSSYFTDFYAVNSFNAFKARNLQDVGTPVCKAFVSTKFPTSKTALDALLEPESPVQFYAWFDEIPSQDATVPARSQYKIYYHIYGGKDSGHYYSVYLKNGPTSSYYNTQTQVMVDTGYVGIGQSIDQTKDPLLPTGFKELCVRIDTEEKCGFKQVTTDFALDYMAKQYVSDQASQEVTSEKDCVSGTPSLMAAAQPNIQSGLEEAAIPEIYNRGIIRVCASDNPGSSTRPERWNQVGYCSNDKKIKCWLDSDSVKGALKDTIYINGTLNAAEDINARLSQLGIWDVKRTNTEISAVEKSVSDMKSRLGKSDFAFPQYSMDSAEFKLTEVGKLITALNDVEMQAYGNERKAYVAYLRWQLYFAIAQNYKRTYVNGINRQTTNPSLTAITSGNEAPIETITSSSACLVNSLKLNLAEDRKSFNVEVLGENCDKGVRMTVSIVKKPEGLVNIIASLFNDKYIDSRGIELSESISYDVAIKDDVEKGEYIATLICESCKEKKVVSKDVVKYEKEISVVVQEKCSVAPYLRQDGEALEYGYTTAGKCEGVEYQFMQILSYDGDNNRVIEFWQKDNLERFELRTKEDLTKSLGASDYDTSWVYVMKCVDISKCSGNGFFFSEAVTPLQEKCIISAENQKAIIKKITPGEFQFLMTGVGKCDGLDYDIKVINFNTNAIIQMDSLTVAGNEFSYYFYLDSVGDYVVSIGCAGCAPIKLDRIVKTRIAHSDLAN